MRARFHRFLLTLLMLALPLQALASVSMLDCTLSHQTVPESVAMADGTMAGCHEPEPSDRPAEQDDCKHCAACALGSALPVSAADGAATTPVPQDYASQPADPFSGFVPDAPERPPRLNLA